MDVNWVNLQALASNKFLDVRKKPGIYFLKWTKFGIPVTLKRLGSSDRNGLLYIGESKDLQRRLKRLWKGIKKVDTADTKRVDTLRKAIIFCNLHKEINSEDYEIAFQHLPTKLDAQIQQAMALQLYTEKYKEPPPLNLKVCKKEYLSWGLNSNDFTRWNGKANKFVKAIIS